MAKMTLSEGLSKALIHAQVFGCTMSYKSTGDVNLGFKQEWICPEHGHIVTLHVDWDKAANDLRLEVTV